MQVIWSRVAQTKSACRCSSCLNNAVTTARRTTTAASKRKPTFAELFTACYTAILGSAAVADAKRKDDRRKEWDRLIAEVRGEKSQDSNDELRIQPTPGDSKGKENSSRPLFTKFNRRGSTTGPMISTVILRSGSSWTSRKPLNSNPITAQSDLFDAHLHRSFSSVAEASVPSQIVPHRGWSHPPPRDPGPDPIKLKWAEKMIAKLVTELLNGAKAQSRASDEDNDNSPEMREMAERIAALQSESRQFPEYGWLTHSGVRLERGRLHLALNTIFQKTEANHLPIDVMVAKICYNLLVTTAPPSIETYNILVRGFCRLQQWALGEAVIRSFFSESNFRANTATARIFLDFYTVKGDIQGFRKIVWRISARNGKDMRIVKIHTKLLWMRNARRWAYRSNTDFTRRGHFLHVKMLRTKGIYDSIIQGILKLQGVPLTIRYVQAAMRAGGRLTSMTLSKLISRCVEDGDVRSARLVLYALLGHPKKKYFKAGAIQGFENILDDLFDLLRLCGVDPSSYNTWSNKLLANRHPRALEQFLLITRTRAIERATKTHSPMRAKLRTLLRAVHQHRTEDRRARAYKWAMHELKAHPLVRKAMAKYFLKESEVLRVEKLVSYRCAVIKALQRRLYSNYFETLFHIYWSKLSPLQQRKLGWLPYCNDLTDPDKLSYLYDYIRVGTYGGLPITRVHETHSSTLGVLTAEVSELEINTGSKLNAFAKTSRNQRIVWKSILKTYLNDKNTQKETLPPREPIVCYTPSFHRPPSNISRPGRQESSASVIGVDEQLALMAVAA